MAILIDGSSPAIATATATATTASFTPPDGALLVIAFAGNSFSSVNPSIPTITDNLGGHLTYALSDWRSRADDPVNFVDGQVAIWTAPIATGAAMTVSVTNNAQSGSQHCAVKVWVLTGATTGGAHGATSDPSKSAIAQSYTAAADGGQGFLVACDWDSLGNETAGSGCTLDGTGTVPTTQISYGFEHRTVADDSNGGLTTLNLSLPGTSTNLTWAWIELVPLVGDPAEKDPPPFVVWHPPGLFAPNGWLNPWTGTANAAPDDTGLRIHPSSPGIAIGPDPGTATAATTASFTPPVGSLLLILWAGNSNFGVNPAAPTITDSLGTPLTYALSDWQSRADAPTVNGQAAIWTAPVITSAPMTVTVNNNAASGFRHQAFQVLVLFNQNSTPVGAHGKSGSTSAALITQSYTAQATGGQGFLVLADFTAVGTPVAGTDCYVASVGDAGTVPPTQLSYGMFKRTIPDDVNTVSNRLNVSLAGISAALSWVYVEILPVSVAFVAAPPGNVRHRAYPIAYLRRSRTAGPVPVQVAIAPPVFVPAPNRSRLKPVLARRRAAQPTPPDQQSVLQTARVRLRLPKLLRGRPTQPVSAQVAPTPPPYVPQTMRARVKAFISRRRPTVTAPAGQQPPPGVTRRPSRAIRPPRGRQAQPVPPQITVTPPSYVPQSVRARARFARLTRVRTAAPVPPQTTVTPPAYPPQGLRARVRGLRLFRPRAATPVPVQIAPAAPAYVPGRPRQAVARLTVLRRPRSTAVPPRQEPVPLFARIKRRVGRLFHSNPRSVVPTQATAAAPDANATSSPTVLPSDISTATVGASRTSTAGAAWTVTSSPSTTAARDSVSGATSSRSSMPTVSDG